MQYEASPNRYEVEQLIGQGASALVFKGTYENNNVKHPVAIKTINLDKASQNIEQLQQETKLLAMCNHPNICPLYQSMVHQQYLWLIMPELQVSILDLLKTLQPIGFDELIIATIMYDVLQAINYLHQNGQIHRDIKLSNFLMDSQGNTLLSDFGVASFIRPFSNDIRSTFVGSPLYMAPEVANNKPYNQAADIWSFGICLYQLSHGNLPHENCQAMEALLRVIQHEPPKISSKRNFSKQFKELIDACLQKNPSERLNASQLLTMKFWTKRADRQQLIDTLKEYQVMRQPKPNAFQEQVDTANNILQSKQSIGLSSSNWNFDEEDPVVEKKPEEPTLPQIIEENDTDIVLSGVQKLVEEVKKLREENTKLKEENERFKDRLKMFMNQEE
ncbi:Kinase [Hexamita inflata]|uniref:non-specific serine/threonine protein kinase n=1 Tax=Hexamita inflata TaxID=28002 RepID=A0AA86RZR8_9EUKA|nr:Kinase [Hexamita inflata]